MTILLVTESFYPLLSGVSISVQRLAAGLATAGHQVAVVVPGGRYRAGFYQREGYTVYTFPALPNPLRKGHRFTLFPYLRLERVFNSVRPELVHVHNPGMLGYQAIQLAARRNIPRVISHHFTLDYLKHYLPGPALARRLLQKGLLQRFKRMYSLCDLIVTPSQTVKQGVAKWGLSVPIAVISNGVEYERFSEAPVLKAWPAKLKIAPEAFVLLYVGRIDPEKNLEVLLQALAILKEPRINLLLVGSGSQTSALKSLVSKLKLYRQVKWLPGIAYTDPLLPSLYRTANLFCIPAVNETESMVSLEAMAAGRPILAANCGALPELVRDGENGHLLPAEDAEAWAGAVRSLQDDPLRSREWGRRSQEFSRAKDIRHSLARWEEVYRQLLKREVI